MWNTKERDSVQHNVFLEQEIYDTEKMKMKYLGWLAWIRFGNKKI